MERGQKIAFVGANGIGKSTLLKSILGLIDPISGTVERGEYQYIGYFEQEVKQSNHNTCIEEIWSEFPSLNQAEVRAALAKCGLTTKHIESKIEVLSGGEKAKVRLCKIIKHRNEFINSRRAYQSLGCGRKRRIEACFKGISREYSGMVSHEPDFYREIATDIWNCEDWTTKVF